MSLGTADKHKIDPLTIIAGIAASLDTVIGLIICLALDFSRANELLMGFSFILGFPMYLLDLWIKKRIAISLLSLFVLRWIARCFAGSTPAF